MEYIDSKIIAHEYHESTNKHKYKVENHVKSKKLNYNPAELVALEIEKERYENEEMKQNQYKETLIKMKENIRKHKQKENENHNSTILKINEKEEKKKKIEDYNKSLQSKIKRKSSMRQNSTTVKQEFSKENKQTNLEYDSNFNQSKSKQEIEQNLNLKDSQFHKNLNQEVEPEYNNFKNTEFCMSINKEEIHWTLAENNEIKNEVSSFENKDNKVLNLRNEVDKAIRNQMIDKTLKSKSLKQQKCDDEDEIDENIEKLRKFRKFGVIDSDPLKKEESKNLLEESKRAEDELQEKMKSKQYQQFKRELEKRRYIKALRNLMVEKFKEKNIFIPNICSCGQLQKKLDKLLENKNVSVFTVINNECANNCIYYNNTHDYHKALTDVINSVKNVKFENFHS